ncbi:MAG: aquaporin [Actinomycetota bacterium]|nr:aquaporin [Actinomycetota bacterium]
MEIEEVAAATEVRPSYRRMISEFLGTAILLLTVVGSGIQATLLSPHDIGLELLENALATAAILYLIITVFAKESGAHFNPLVTFFSATKGELTSKQAIIEVVLQFSGAILGTITANSMFGVPITHLSNHIRQSSPHFLSEVIATFLLITVIELAGKTYDARAVPALVATLIGAAYFFTSSTSFANPAAVVGRMFTNSFAGISPSSSISFIIAEIIGASGGYLFSKIFKSKG